MTPAHTALAHDAASHASSVHRASSAAGSNNPDLSRLNRFPVINTVSGADDGRGISHCAAAGAMTAAAKVKMQLVSKPKSGVSTSVGVLITCKLFLFQMYALLSHSCLSRQSGSLKMKTQLFLL
jgi:hypothetical protein